MSESFRYFLILLSVLFCLTGNKNLVAQSQKELSFQPVYGSPVSESLLPDHETLLLKVKDASFDAQKMLPVFVYNEKLQDGYSFDAYYIKKITTQPCSPEEKIALKDVEQTSLSISVKEATSAKINYLNAQFYPYHYEKGQWKKVTSLELHIRLKKGDVAKFNKRSIQLNNSVLSSGSFYKFSYSQSGIYKITAAQLQEAGISIDGWNVDNIQLYSGGGRMMEKDNSLSHPDDLKEMAIDVVDNGDNVFNGNDYILFYGDGPNYWDYKDGEYEFKRHLYADKAYVFLTVGTSSGKRLASVDHSGLSETQTLTTYDELLVYENELENVLKSGNRWLGESFEFENQQSFSLAVPNVNTSFDAEITFNLAARSTLGSNFFNISINSGNATTVSIPTVSGLYYATYARTESETITFQPSTNNQISLSYSKPDNASKAWLDNFIYRGKSNLNLGIEPLIFRNAEGISPTSISRYDISSSTSNIKVWEVTDPWEVSNQLLTVNGANHSFKTPFDTLRTFVAFSVVSNTPTYEGVVTNQNLHGLSQVDYIIVSHPDFMEQANRLASYHEQQSGLSVHVVNVNEVYNEFSGGQQDVMAIRNLCRMFYKRASGWNNQPKYLLLFGDGSYDPLNRISDNSNFVVSYQSPESFTPTTSYVSDDIFVFLDDDEGEWTNNSDAIDMGVGRFPVQTVEEAKAVVEKTIAYADEMNRVQISETDLIASSNASFGDWRNNVVFVADDEDGNIHVNQSQQLAEQVGGLMPEMNLRKIYFDTYPQVSSAGGNRYPGVKNAINNSFRSGAFLINYTGHGGELGWAHERVLELDDIETWENENNLPILMTATCEFSRFDNPELTSAGERVILKDKGGAVALLTTVRLVYSSPNFVLNQHFFESLFDTSSAERPRLGDVFRTMKVASGSAVNHRNFTLLGDPALMPAFPKRRVVTTHINGQSIQSYNDSLSSLEKVRIQGHVLNNQGVKDASFNGILIPSIYDKPSQLVTLANDGGNTFEFSEQSSILFKGKVSVVAGEFSFEFIVPKDISYTDGLGKISYYLQGEDEDGAGYFDSLLIGGTGVGSINDTEGPSIRLMMNDENFVDGGVTNESPILIVDLVDSSGINTVGNGIGHDLVAVLNDETTNPFVLNDFYESAMDDYTKGRVEYQLFDLEEGNHQLSFKAWDVVNNSSEERIDFIVASDQEIVVEHLLNYPNPFTTSTSFYFDHNQIGQTLDLQLQIFTISGRLVKSFNQTKEMNSFRSEPIHWDGLDEFGNQLARGVYMYQLTVSRQGAETVQKIQKLVILK